MHSGIPSIIEIKSSPKKNQEKVKDEIVEETEDEESFMLDLRTNPPRRHPLKVTTDFEPFETECP